MSAAAIQRLYHAHRIKGESIAVMLAHSVLTLALLLLSSDCFYKSNSSRVCVWKSFHRSTTEIIHSALKKSRDLSNTLPEIPGAISLTPHNNSKTLSTVFFMSPNRRNNSFLVYTFCPVRLKPSLQNHVFRSNNITHPAESCTSLKFRMERDRGQKWILCAYDLAQGYIILTYTTSNASWVFCNHYDRIFYSVSFK